MVRLREIAPEVPTKLMQKLMEAPDWGDVNAFVSEKNVFDRQYEIISSFYYATAGKVAFDIFTEYKPVVDAFVRHSLKSDDVPGEPLRATLVGEIATGNSQAFIRPLTYRSFSNVAYSHLPSSTGSYDLIPNTSGSETATTKQKAWIILGWIDPLVGSLVPYDEIQVDISDSETKRRPLYPRLQFAAQGADNVKVIKESSPKMVEPGNTIDINIQVRTANVQFGLFPLGVELIRADAAAASGPLG